MGLYDSTTTTTVAPPTPQELQDASKISGAAAAQMAALGYVGTTTQKQEYKNPDTVASLEATIADMSRQSADLDAKILAQQDLVNRGIASYDSLTTFQQQKQGLATQLNAKQGQLDNEKKNSVTTYETVYEDADVAKLRAEGKTSEADALANERAQQAVELRQDQNEVAAAVIEATKRYLNTDWNKELSDSAKAIQGPVMEQLDKLSEQIRSGEARVMAQYDEQGNQITSTFTGAYDALNNVISKIKETGLSTDAAITESAVRAKAGNMDLLSAIDGTIKASRALAEQGLFQQTRDLRNSIALTAAASGRSDLDPAFVRELNNKTLEAKQNVDLSLAVTSAQTKYGALQNLETTLQQLDAMRVQNAEQTGRRTEAVSAEQAGLTERTGLRREELAGVRAGVTQEANLAQRGVTSARASLLESTLTDQENKRIAIMQGLPAYGAGVSNQLSANVGASSLIGNVATATAPIGADLAGLRGIRSQETTTTQQGSTLGGILSGIGGLASSAGSVMTGVGALKYGASALRG